MAVIYAPHLKHRLKERKFPQNYPLEIYNTARIRYYDTLSKSFIAIKMMNYGGRRRKIAIAYIFVDSDVIIKTVHPESDKEIKNRVSRGRWIKI